MWKSGPFRDAYCLFGVDPRKDKKWAGYQTAIFNFRQDKESPKKVKEETAEMQAQEKEGKSHLFTGRDVGTKVASYCFRDVTDPMLRKILDDVVLRDKFHVNPQNPLKRYFPSVALAFGGHKADGRKMTDGIPRTSSSKSKKSCERSY